MERMIESRDIKHMACVERIKQLEEENKTLKDNVEFLHSCLDDRDKSIAIMQEENEKLKDDLLHYIRREEDYREENKKLKSDLSECECSFGFENDEVGYRKRECKKLKEEIKSRQEEVERFKTNAMQDMSEITELEIENKKLKEELEKLRTDNIYEEGLYN